MRLEAAGWCLDHADLPRPLTPAALAARLATRPAAPQQVARASPARLPLADFARVMVLDSLANAGSAMWTDQLAFTLSGPLDLARLARAWREVIAAEPALRSAIDVATLEQVVRDDVDAELVIDDLRRLDPEAYRLRVRAEEWTRMSTGFRLDRAPLHALRVLAGPGDRHDLVLTYHHAILDGESARHVVRALLATYAGRARRHGEPAAIAIARRTRSAAAVRAQLAGYAPAPAPAPVAATGFGDAVWRVVHGLVAMRTRVAAARVARRCRREPLRAQLADARLTPPVFAGGDVASQPLPRSMATAIASTARAANTTPLAVWAVALALHLARERHTRDVVFGVVLGGRDGRSVDTIGMLAACVPLRVDVDPAEHVAALLGRAGARLADLHAGVPLFDLGIDLREVLDTQLVSWGFGTDPAWTPPPGVTVHGGRGITMTAHRLALVVSPGEVASGAATLQRTDRIRREVLALVDAVIASPAAPVSDLLALVAHEGGFAIATPDL